MNHQRPVNLDLGSLKYPPMAIASILHRISGLVLFLLLPVMLYFLALSLHSLASYEQLQKIMTNSYGKSLLWLFGSASIYHVVAGIRHMLMDVGVGESLHVAKRTAVMVIVIAAILIVALGVRIW